MRVKKGVQFNGVQPETVLAVQVASQIVTEHGGRFVITSLTDGSEWRKHWSLHLKGLAFDIRIWDFPEKEDQLKLTAALQDALGKEFDVVLESDHIHVEFDPDPEGKDG